MKGSSTFCVAPCAKANDARQLQLQLCCAGAGGGDFLWGPAAAIITTQSRDQTQITVITRRLGGLACDKIGGEEAQMAPRTRLLRYSFAGDAACKVPTAT